MRIAYLTSNNEKFQEAVHILKGWSLERVSLDLPEVQGDAEEVCRQKAHAAAEKLKRPLIVEDVSMSCRCLGGLPGPYIKDFLRHLGDKGLADLVHRYSDHHATVSCLAAYVAAGGQALLFHGSLQGTIVAPRGTMGHGLYSWNAIFQPDGYAITMGEMTLEEHAAMSMRRLALEKLKAFLEQGSRAL